MSRKVRSLSERFWEKVSPGPGCWEWTGYVTPQGYGTLFGGPSVARPLLAHRVSYELARGPIPSGRELDHLCRNRRCVNPAHLEPVTALVNWERGESPSLANRAKDRCPRGHRYTTDNTWRNAKGHRWCRHCARIKALRRYRFQREMETAA